MTITLELRPEIEERVLAQAQAQGVSPERYLARVIEAQVTAVESPETLFLTQIQQGLPEATWQRYDELQAKREAEQLAPAEHAELIGLIDEIEGWNVRRLELAQQLAACRGVSWERIVTELGLTAPVHG
jgi:hypothetical protein